MEVVASMFFYTIFCYALKKSIKLYTNVYKIEVDKHQLFL